MWVGSSCSSEREAILELGGAKDLEGREILGCTKSLLVFWRTLDMEKLNLEP